MANVNDDEVMKSVEMAVEQNDNMLDGVINNGANDREIPGTFDAEEMENEWEQLKNKQVYDSDGFTTDYTLYHNIVTDQYVCIFGDRDLYRPENSDFDWEGDSEEEAFEWFDSYEEDTLLQAAEELSEDKPFRFGRLDMYDKLTIEVHDGLLTMDVPMTDEERSALSPSGDFNTWFNVGYSEKDGITGALRGEDFSEEVDVVLSEKEKQLLKEYVEGVIPELGIALNMDELLKLDISQGNTYSIEKAMALIDEYSQNEFGDNADFTNLSDVGLAYTTDLFGHGSFTEEELEEMGLTDPSYKDQEFEIQVSADLLDHKINTFIDGELLVSEEFDSLDSMLPALENLDFDALYTLSDENWQKFADRLIDKEAKKAIDDHEAEFGADGSRVFPHLNDGLEKTNELLFLYPEADTKKIADTLTAERIDFHFRDYLKHGATFITFPARQLDNVKAELDGLGVKYASDKAEELAIKLDDLSYGYDTYNYNDYLDVYGSREDCVKAVYSDLVNGNIREHLDFLDEVIDSDDLNSSEVANGIKNDLEILADKNLDAKDFPVFPNSSWQVMSNPVNGEMLYAVYRQKDTRAVDHSSNRELVGGYVNVKDYAETVAGMLNRNKVTDLGEAEKIANDRYILESRFDDSLENINVNNEKEGNLMNFDEFKAYVAEHIKDFLPESYADASVRIAEVTKNNDQVKTGLLVRNENSNIAPNIYLESFFDELTSGSDINDVMTHLAEVRIAHEVEQDLDTSFVSDFDKAKEHIVPKLVSKEMNETLLSGIPYTDFSDMAVMYQVKVGNDEIGKGSITITNNIMESYGITTEQLHDIAISNMKTEDIEFKTMRDVLANMMGIDLNNPNDPRAFMLPPEEETPSMYVLTNTDRVFGAVAVINTDIMDGIADKIGGDFVVIPSSIHEVIVLPCIEGFDPKEIEELIATVNNSEVNPEDRLSYNAYGYDSQKHELVLAADLPFFRDGIQEVHEEAVAYDANATVNIPEAEVPSAENKTKETISFEVPSKNVGDSFKDKHGKERIKVVIPNEDRNDKTPWRAFFVDASQVEKGDSKTTITIPKDASHNVYKDVDTGVKDAVTGKSIFNTTKENLSNEQLKAAVEKTNPSEKITIRVSDKLVGEPFTTKDGKEMISVKVPNEDTKDLSPMATFLVPASFVSEKDDKGKRDIKLISNVNVNLKKAEIGTDGRYTGNQLDAGKLTTKELAERFQPAHIKDIVANKEAVKAANEQNKTQEKSKGGQEL